MLLWLQNEGPYNTFLQGLRWIPFKLSARTAPADKLRSAPLMAEQQFPKIFQQQNKSKYLPGAKQYWNLSDDDQSQFTNESKVYILWLQLDNIRVYRCSEENQQSKVEKMFGFPVHRHLSFWNVHVLVYRKSTRVKRHGGKVCRQNSEAFVAALEKVHYTFNGLCTVKTNAVFLSGEGSGNS